MVHFSDYSGRVEEIVLPEEGPTELDAAITVAEAAWAEQEARKADAQPGLTLWTDGSRDANGGTGYAVVWRKGRTWVGRKVHMGYYQEAYDAECAATARALAVAAGRAKRHKLGKVRIFTDAQAAIARMTHDELGPGQTYASRRSKRQRSCAGRNPLSISRSTGAWPTKGFPETRSSRI